MAVHHAWDEIGRCALRTILLQQHVSGPVAVAIIYPHRSGLATRVRVVVDLPLNDLRRKRILSIDKFA